MKLHDYRHHKTKIGTTTCNWLQPRKSIATKIISLPHAICKSFFVTREPDRYTVGMDSTYRRTSAYDLTLTEWTFLILGAFAIVFGFVWYLWFLHDLDQTFRAWLQVAK